MGSRSSSKKKEVMWPFLDGEKQCAVRKIKTKRKQKTVKEERAKSLVAGPRMHSKESGEGGSQSLEGPERRKNEPRRGPEKTPENNCRA